MLDERDIKMILLKFGFINGQPMTYEKIAKYFGKSRQLIELRISKALKKLSQSSDIYNLLVYSANEKEAQDNLKSLQMKKFHSNMDKKTLDALYNYFDDYSNKEVNDMLRKLKKKEKDLLCYYRFDWLNYESVYEELIIKMQALLDDNKMTRILRK